MGASISFNVVNHQGVLDALKEGNILITVISNHTDATLIKGTLGEAEELRHVNEIIRKKNLDERIFVYGENCSDSRVYSKARQLKKLGLKEVFVYTGGIFEWMLLGEVFGQDQFPVHGRVTNVVDHAGESFVSLIID